MNRFTIILMFFLLSGCFITGEIPEDKSPWPYKMPSFFGVSEPALNSLNQSINNFEFENIKSVVVLHRDAIIFENYYNQSHRQISRIENLTSVFANLALGLAIEDGLIVGVTDSLHLYLPEYTDMFEQEPLKRQITLEHLLIHKSGLSWNESIVNPYSPDNNLNQMRNTSDWSAFVITQPLEALPGSRLNFNTGTAMLISKVISNVTGMSLESYITTQLFAHIKIEDWHWVADPSGITDAAGGLSLSTLDLARIGSLFLNQGDWKGKQLVPQSWITQSVSLQTQVSNQYHFGYLWWLFDDSYGQINLEVNDAFFFPGAFGNHLYVVPHKNLVVSISAQNLGNALYNPSIYIYFAVLNSLP